MTDLDHAFAVFAADSDPRTDHRRYDMTAEACATCGHPESSHGIAARCIGNRNLCACRRYIAAPVTPPTDTTEADYLSGFTDGGAG